MDELNVSIVFYGRPNGMWLEWYEDAKKVFDIVGHEYNYVGTTLMDQMRTVKRTEKRVYRELENNQVSDITMKSLQICILLSFRLKYTILYVRR